MEMIRFFGDFLVSRIIVLIFWVLFSLALRSVYPFSVVLACDHGRHSHQVDIRWTGTDVRIC